MSATKACSKCHLVLSIENFSWERKSIGKRHASCKKCVREYVSDVDVKNEPRACTKCKIVKDADSFHFANVSVGRRHGACKECQAVADSRRHKRKREDPEYVEQRKKYMQEYTPKYNATSRQHRKDYLKDKCCVHCGLTDLHVLEFDHLHSKVQMVSSLRSIGGENIRAEIAKCQVLCANCHSKKTARERNFYSHQYVMTGSIVTTNVTKRKNQLYVLDYLKTHHCVHCGESDPRCLEFDHLSQETKVDCIGTLMKSRKLEVLIEEMAKCRVLCRNCHKKRTDAQLGQNKPIEDLFTVEAEASQLSHPVPADCRPQV